MARQAVAFFEAPGGPARADVVGTAFMAAGLALAGIGIGLTIAPIGTAVVNGVRDQERGMAASLVIIVRLIGMSISMSSMTAYGLRRTTILGRELLRPEDAMDLEKTAQVALEAVTRVTSEISLIALAVAATATAVALLLRKGDVSLASVTSQTSTLPVNGCGRRSFAGHDMPCDTCARMSACTFSTRPRAGRCARWWC
jgi:hypothetical protein